MTEVAANFSASGTIALSIFGWVFTTCISALVIFTTAALVRRILIWGRGK